MSNLFLSNSRSKPLKPESAKRVGKAKKSLLDRTIETFDQEVKDFNAGKKYENERAARRAFFKDLGSEVSVSVKAGNVGLDLVSGDKVRFVDKKEFKAQMKDLRELLVSGHYNDQIEKIEKSFTDRAANRKPRAPKA